MPRSFRQRLTKRAFDVAVAGGALVTLSPVMLAIGVAIARDMGAPIIFRQKRPGKNGKLFNIWKFRTMRDATGPDGEPLPDAERITALGEFLRRSSLDELPELVNVLKGDMSLVGPRPLLPEYLPLYNETQARRHEVRPGITGLAQVNGRNAMSWEEKFEHDVWYVDHHNLAMDLNILVKTVMAVLRKEGISAEGHATMPRFTGSKPGTPLDASLEDELPDTGFGGNAANDG